MVPVPHCLDYCSFVVLSEVWENYASCLVFVPQNRFGNSGSVMVPYKCLGISGDNIDLSERWFH